MQKSLKNLGIILLLSILSSTAPAQPGNRRMEEKKEDIEAMKIAFISKKLSLTPDEAKVFWPVYNEYSDKLHELRKKRRKDFRENRDKMEEMSDKEVEFALDNDFNFRQKELDLQKEYHLRFKSVLPVKKVAKLYATEEQFKKVLLDRLQEKPYKD